MRPLKKMISRYMQLITLIVVAIILFVIVGVQMLNEQQRARENAAITFHQMEQVLEANQQELAEIVEEYSQTCLHNAEAIAYIIQQNPSVLESVDELNKIAEFIEVDEIHIFDTAGQIFTGTHPEYYGFTFDTGEQMTFFKPMLEDRSLKLVQDITPNTAEAKLMQYSAIWSVGKEFIVQVGMAPVTVMEVTEKNELSYVFSRFRVSAEANYYAIDEESGEIVGSTDLGSVRKNLTEIGLNIEDITNKASGFHADINGVNSYCVFERIGTNYIGRVISSDVLYQRIPASTVALVLCLFLSAIVLARTVTWAMNQYVVEGIQDVNAKLRVIGRGNLEERVDVHNSMEFSELSDHINDMIKSILDNNKKMSYVLSKTDMYIGVYEYNEYMKKVRFTEHIPKILMLDTNNAEQLSSDYTLFKEFMERIYANPVAGENGVYKLNAECERYVKLEEINDNNEIFGVIIDVTEAMLKRKQMEAERDIDALTGLYNRGGLDLKLSRLFNEPEKLGHSALLMIDADGLKEINDTYGHEKGDIYLKKISEVLSHLGLKRSVAARQGGDEFVLFLYQYEDEEELMNNIRTLEYIQEHSVAHFDDNLSVPLRFSVGYSLVHGEADYQELLKEADKKMYENKRERKRKTPD